MGNPYYVFFSPETIRMIAEKYMKNQYTRNNDLMHDGKAVRDVYVIESWIKEDENDKSVKYGYGDLPIGTWFVSMKVKNDETWNKVKSGELNGFSVSGFFEEVQSFTKEEMFLYKVAEVLKNIKD
jgi:predicted glutamine amidotransferase